MSDVLAAHLCHSSRHRPTRGPIRVVEQEILDELEFHLEMRTLDNVKAGMSAAEARQDAVRRFGDFERIHKACRRTLLGERIMLQRIQAVLTLVLLGAVIFMGVALYRGQQANEAATARMMQMNEAAAELCSEVGQLREAATKPPPCADPPSSSTVPRTADRNVDPSLTEIRVTYNKPMMDGSWSWCYDPDQLKTTGKPHYEADGKTCVLPVKLEPGKIYTIPPEYARLPQLQGHGGTIGGSLCAAV